ncbi:aromatic ring-hydroxylating dioxygenase subunit alpha [Fertoebacter nigrum]|uniref:Aromatic ring-hydroxylating dioxygenase subunit alpha n=1 Tax=Fertoeibacter niger TaxID=2656921 RepID=A0A8X8KMM3_9RHOB|nr:aromatic ring-hydroxylating dioxygenase subunit alpha [Fertoeibacter niger]NUB42876.1 aromatic ring-hydroxylating dioxygenase subunit alpha [Fertoeibacter niger]
MRAVDHITPPDAGDYIDRLVAAQVPGIGLSREFYHDPAIYERDLDRVFRRHWHCIGHESIIPNPNDFELFRMATEQVILTRDTDGVVHALLNICRHRGAEVCTEAKGNAKAFVCPYHAWTYGNDGRLKAARLMPKDFRREDHGLRKLHVRVAAGLVFISFADDPLDFAEVERLLQATCGQYGWADARVAHRQTYPVDANWKLAVENYVECYHCGPAHPEYSQTHALEQPLDRIAALNAAMEQRTTALGIDVGQDDLWQTSQAGREAIHAFRYALYDGVQSGSEDGRPVAPLMGRFTDFDGGVTSVHLGGTSFLVCYADHGMIYRFVPTGVDSCEMELIWLVNGSAAEGRDYDLARLTWLWSVTTAEDKTIIEHTARGVRSKYFVPGPIAPMEQNELRYIGWYLEEIARP